MAGVKAITADVDPDACRLTETLCDEYDINVAIHNHGRKHRYGTMAQLDALFARTTRRFGLCLDTAWLLDAGEDPIAAVHRYADRLYGVHLKDFAFDAAGKPVDVIVGTGGLDLPALVRDLNDMDYAGYLSLEYEGNPDSPLPEVIQCVQAVQRAIEALAE
jgi:sugar phosphate isomerase/epimerase